jgi:hypothetical protein
VPSGQTLAVVIADSPPLLLDPYIASHREGAMYTIAPQIDFYVGPVSLPEFFAFKQGFAPIPRLAEQEQRRNRKHPGVPVVPKFR